MEKPVNCLKCQFCHITWDPRRPYGCRYFGFKGARLPWLEVLESSGETCRAFVGKKLSGKRE